MWLITSWYLGVTAMFFAAMLGVNTQARLDALTRGCVIGGVIASLAAIIGYSRVFPSLNELLLLYDRARGTFKDPNVLGAFLIFPTLLALQPVISGTSRQAAQGRRRCSACMAPAILLSFSRAAWGQIVYTALADAGADLHHHALAVAPAAHRAAERRRRRSCSAGFIAALLSIDSVADLFKQRASLEQSYDLGAQGRFAPLHARRASWRSTSRSASGRCSSHKYFPEDTHNSFLNAFMSGGWLSGSVLSGAGRC